MLDVKSGVFGALENNCYLITDTETGLSALIDCTDSSEDMIDFISGSRLEYILLTHGHFDHIGGVAEISKKTGAEIVISAEDAPMLTSSRLSLAAFSGISQEPAEAEITIKDGSEISLGSSLIKVIATPGHTTGSVCYLCGEKLFCGDTLFRCSCGRTDFPGGSSDDMLSSLLILAGLNGNPTVYPGHGGASTLDYERRNNPYINRNFI